jgi:proteasome lid subunit RPN8/RPN11
MTMNNNPKKQRLQQAVQMENAMESTSFAKQPEPRQRTATRRERTHPSSATALRFSPTAWAKLLYFRDRQNTEIGGFGILAPDDLLYVQEFVTVRQRVTVASVAFEDDAVADYFEDQVDAGRRPEQFARVWLHSHPGNSPQPSATDEETFHRVFGKCHWAVMFVLAHGGKSYARLRFNVGPGGHMIVPVEVDCSRPFGPSDLQAWEAEYVTNIKADSFGFGFDDDQYGTSLTDTSFPDEWLEQLDDMDPAEQRMLLDELAVRAADGEVSCEH